MATRFYLNTIGFPHVRPTVDSGWENGNLALELWHSRRIMHPWRSGGPDSQPFGVENQNAVHDILIAQYISEPLATQTISGTIRAVIQAAENNASANWRSQMRAWVMAPDGSVRGVLTNYNTGALSNEWNVTTPRSAYFPVGSTGTTVTNVNAIAGDRIVVDLGARTHDTSATTYNGRLRLGDRHFTSPGTNFDLPSNQTDTTSTKNGWIEFSANLTFQTTPVAISDSIAGALDVMPAAEGHVIATTTSANTFTTESDDPTSMATVNYAGTLGFTGWVKLVGPTGGARVRIEGGGGIGIEPFIYVFTDVPVAGSSYESYLETVDIGSGSGALFTDVAEGQTKYVCIAAGDGSFETFSLGDSNYALFISRERVGEISDSIADAPDLLPATQDSSLSAFSPDADFWTGEADDPDHIETEYSGDSFNFTGWVKLVVPSSGIKVNIDTYLPIDYAQGSHDVALLVFDEVPTASSVPIAEADFTPDASPPAGSIDQQWFGKAKIPDLNLVSGTTYYVCVLAGAYWGRFWEYWAEGTAVQVTVYRHLDGAAEVVEDAAVDAIVRRVTEPPIYIDTPAFVDKSEASVDSGVSNTLTLGTPPGVEQNDLLVAVISADIASTTGLAVTAVESGWTALTQTTVAGSALHVVRAFYRFADDLSATYGFRSLNGTSVSTLAKAGAILAFRNASVPILRASNGSSTIDTSPKQTPSWFVLSTDPNYQSAILQMNVYAGGRAGVTTWTTSAPNVERVDVSASAGANLFISTTPEVLDNFVESRSATPSAAEFNLTQVIHITARTTDWRVGAVIEPGGALGINAVLVDGISTKHDRSVYHFSMTPADKVYSTQTYGPFPPGTSLQDVLAGLDEMITDLEAPES